jgi:predicted pyridoxine 5'-phosphate oxidase superfamily flavin-nucleotide-binding protein
MRNEFLRTLATPSVQAEQVRSYGRSRVPAPGGVTQLLGTDEQTFIAARDSFYLSSINEDGWPYIQHRGGPKGFVRVVNGTQLVFGDYTGNRQLISAGNVQARHRVALFFMDYPARERLKIIGHAEVLMPDDAKELITHLSVPKGAAIERVFRIDVVGFDWNCPKYITPRFTTAEIEEAVAPLKERIAELETILTLKKEPSLKS